MIDKWQANALMDVYGGLLTNRQQEILSLYFEEDFSYFEISESLNISRAAVLDAVHKAVKQLEKYEEKIGYLKKKKQISSICDMYAESVVSAKIKDIL